MTIINARESPTTARRVVSAIRKQGRRSACGTLEFRSLGFYRMEGRWRCDISCLFLPRAQRLEPFLDQPCPYCTKLLPAILTKRDGACSNTAFCCATHMENPCPPPVLLRAEHQARESTTGNGRKRCMHPCGGQAPLLFKWSSETPSPQKGWALPPLGRRRAWLCPSKSQ